jgi:hypothetical protein
MYIKQKENKREYLSKGFQYILERCPVQNVCSFNKNLLHSNSKKANPLWENQEKIGR